MANGEQRGNREARKPKKPSPPKPNASNPSVKGTPPPPPADEPANAAPRSSRTVTLAFAGDVHFEGGVARLLDDGDADLGPMAAALRSADVAVVNLDTDSGQANVYMPSDPRVQVLTEMGFVNAPGVVALDESDGADAFFSTISFENVTSIDADVIVAFTPEGFDFSSVPALTTLPAVSRGSAISLTDTKVVAELSNVNPVSTPWVLDRILPQLKDAADRSA